MNGYVRFCKGIALLAIVVFLSLSSGRFIGHTQQQHQTDGRLVVSNRLQYANECAYDVQSSPNDPRLSEQYYHQSMNNFSAWAMQTDSPAYIFDFSSGVAYHPDLEQNVRRDMAIDTTAENGDAIDREGSGTAGAGLIAAVGNNGIGGAGVVWHTNLVPVKVLRDDGKGLIADFNTGMLKALNEVESKHLQAVFYIGLSFGVDYAGTFELFKRAKKDGVIVVVRAGDSGVDLNDYGSFPASYATTLDNILVATSTDIDDRLAAFANKGIGRVVGAPGKDLDTTYLDNDYASVNGTGASAALLAGACALLMHDSSLTYRDVIARIKQSSRTVTNAGDLVIGLVDTSAALTSTAQFVPQPIAQFQAELIEGVANKPVKLNLGSSEVAPGYHLKYRIVDFGERLPSPTSAQDSPKFEHVFKQPYSFVVKGVVNDGIQDSVPVKMQVKVRPFENRAPSVKIHPSVISTHLGEETTITWRGVDNEHDPLSYDIYFAPGGLHFTTAKQKITFMFDKVEELGDYTVKIFAHDALQSSQEATAVLKVFDSIDILEATYDNKTRRLHVIAVTNAQPLSIAKLSVKGYGVMETTVVNVDGKEITAQVFDAIVDVKPHKKITVLSTYGGSATHVVK